jgi:hypothetical protein
VTITDDGDAGTFEFSSSTFSGLEDAGTINVTVTRLGGASSTSDVNVTVFTTDGSAVAHTDYGQALQFDGTAEWVRIQSAAFSSQIVTSGTWETWIKLEEYPNYGNLMSKFLWASLDGYRITVREGMLSFFSGCGARTMVNCPDSVSLTNAAIDISLHMWYHIGVVKNGAAVSLFVNGEPITLSSTAAHGDLQLSDAAFEFGHIEGFIDELRLWSVARTSEEIKASMYKTLNGAESGILMYWDFDHPEDIRGQEGVNHGVTASDWIPSTVPQSPSNVDAYKNDSILVGDYQVFNRSIAFAEGQKESVVSIRVINDVLYDPYEMFTVSLTDPTGGAIVRDATASVYIDDDGDAGEFSFSSATFRASEDSQLAFLTVIRTGGSRNATSVTYTTSDGTATGDADFEQTSEVVYFMDRETSKTITIAITNDTTYESPD